MLLCFACVATLCALELVHQSDVFYGSVLQVYCMCCAIQSAQIAVEWLRQSFSKGTGSPLLCLAIPLVFCRSLLADRIGIATSWMRFECYRNVHETLFFPGKRRFRCGEKLARAVTVLGVAALPPNPARCASAVELRAPGDFFSSFLTLCYCVLPVL